MGTREILVSGKGIVKLAPPTSGTYQGISFFQQRTQTDRLQILGNGNVYIGGLQISGDGSFNVDLGGNPPPPNRNFSLVE